MTITLEESNAALRSAVEIRTENQAAGKPLTEWYDRPKVYGHEGEPRGPSAAEVIKRFSATDTLAVATLRQAIDAVNDRHGRYGPPQEHFGRTAALVNAAFGTAFTPADWALVMVLDKVARQMGPQATDDAAIDIAGYAACHQECRRQTT